MTEAIDQAASMKPPARPLGQKVFDILLWGGLAVLLLVSFGPAEINKLPQLFQNNENMRQYGREFIRPDWTDVSIYVRRLRPDATAVGQPRGEARLPGTNLRLLASNF